jgi:bifunctional non-homologous end joining protein LigD
MRPYRGSDPRAHAVANRSPSRRGGPRVEVAGVSLSHPDRVFWPDDGITKLELARYYESVAARMVPEVAGRPLTLVRCPKDIGECAYMRHLKVWGPAALRRIRIPEKQKVGEYLVADDLAGVIGLVQMDIVEIHTWNCTDADLERPDRLVLDLDPGEAVPWHDVAEAALRLRALLSALELDSFVKSTGGKGLHVVVPLQPHASWSECLDFSRALSALLERDNPRLYTLNMSRARRHGRIFLDYLRNNRGNSSVAAFSTRARSGAPISVPLGWDELQQLPDYTLRRHPRRWRPPFRGHRGRLTKTMVRAVRAAPAATPP